MGTHHPSSYLAVATALVLFGCATGTAAPGSSRDGTTDRDDGTAPPPAPDAGPRPSPADAGPPPAAGCVSDADCGAGNICWEGVCEPDEGPPPGGAACTTDADCGAGNICWAGVCEPD